MDDDPLVEKTKLEWAEKKAFYENRVNVGLVGALAFVVILSFTLALCFAPLGPDLGECPKGMYVRLGSKCVDVSSLPAVAPTTGHRDPTPSYVFGAVAAICVFPLCAAAPLLNRRLDRRAREIVAEEEEAQKWATSHC